MGFGRSLLEMIVAVLIIAVVFRTTAIVVLMETKGDKGRGFWTGVVPTFFGIAEIWASIVESLVMLAPRFPSFCFLPCLFTDKQIPSVRKS